ncbi:LysM peptidoglycan-binding domain-containing protein [Lactobacillus delbrueckii subsp. lactis]|uniref:muramidase family protein n=1 Tax=Lactobacillus delbrueckii TaxID=1584 RepID=UPI001E2E733D|nr:LysM domain-containing protein [Lactobacillus delbrueckii]MCD5528904.1 LysM peptidoglycan-binding domain-containing protein [Lactobacillus delbrueckii subsp. lactis]MCS8607353.1 LysM domain-containing protein [Lactobacillus delbrueckii subsp. lactis]
MAKRKRAESNAVKKAKTLVSKYREAAAKAKKAYISAQRLEATAKRAGKKAKAAKYAKLAKAQKNAYNRYLKLQKSAESKYQKVAKKAKILNNLKSISREIASHKRSASGLFEGKAAIYASDGSSTTIVYISPNNTESQTISNDITSWAVDSGAPMHSFARVSQIEYEVSGTITGKTRHEAEVKYAQLRTWAQEHKQLTYTGDQYSSHLMIASLSKSYSADMAYNLNVSISFSLVYTASIAISPTKKSSKKKTSKSSKAVSGGKSRSYTTITIKPGDTLWALSRKYGKSVAWLQKVNGIKNANLIYAGKKLRVK